MGKGQDKERGKPSRWAVASWVVYDLANTIFSMNITSLYFSLWVVNLMGGTDADYGFANSISMGIVFLFSPLLGALSDQSPRRMPFLVVSTVLCIALTFLLGKYGLMAGLVLYVVANICYQAGLQFYDSFLPLVSTESNRGRIGGIGVSVGYGGSFIGLILGILIIGTAEKLPHAVQLARYDLLFQLTAVVFLLFALPCFIFLREKPLTDRRFSWDSIPRAVRQIRETVRFGVNHHPDLIRFLVGRACYTDAINTVIMFMGIYVTNEVGFTGKQVSYVMMAAIAFAIAGGLIWGPMVDRIGPKRTLDLVLFLWMFTFLWIAAVGFFHLPGAVFFPAPCLAGIAMGGTWAADRPYMLRLTPPGRIGEYYGLYNMVGRFSAVTGPLLWALVADKLGMGRPAAILTLLGAVVLSWLILRPVSDRRRHWNPRDMVGAREPG